MKIDRAAKALRRALEPFVELYPTMPVSYAISFLAVAEKEGRPVNEYASEVGVNKAVMTRHLLDLGERDRHGGEGMGIHRRSPRPQRPEDQAVLYQREGRNPAQQSVSGMAGPQRACWTADRPTFNITAASLCETA
jgi:hypothetical protein